MLTNEAVVVRDALEPRITREASLVRKALKSKGLETPMTANRLTDEQKREAILIQLNHISLKYDSERTN